MGETSARCRAGKPPTAGWSPRRRFQERVWCFGEAHAHKSLFENCEGCCGEGFGLGPRRRGGSISKAGCADRVNGGQSQTTRRPKGFRAEGRLASLLLSRRPMKGILLRRASPSGLLPENSTPPHFQTGFKDRSDEAGVRPNHGPVARSQTRTVMNWLVPFGQGATTRSKTVSVRLFPSSVAEISCT